MKIEIGFAASCSESVVQLRYKDYKSSPIYVKKEIDKILSNWLVSKASNGYIDVKFKKGIFIKRYFYQHGIPHGLVNLLRRHNIEFYGYDFTCMDPLEDKERLKEDKKKVKIRKRKMNKWIKDKINEKKKGKK